jgi:hypothetical protein
MRSPSSKKTTMDKTMYNMAQAKKMGKQTWPHSRFGWPGLRLLYRCAVSCITGCH